jgi:hypothetical protein
METVEDYQRCRGLCAVFGGRAKGCHHLRAGGQHGTQQVRLGGIHRHAQRRLSRQLQRGAIVGGEGVVRQELRLQKARGAAAKLEAGFAIHARRERHALGTGRQIAGTVHRGAEGQRQV